MSGIVWTVEPKQISLAIDRYRKNVEAAVFAVCAYHGQAMQDTARRQAPWVDRTGNARGGLFYAVELAGFKTVVGQVAVSMSSQDTQYDAAARGTCVVWLSHTMYYGKFLELANGGKYAVVMSTIETHLPALMSSLQGLIA